MTFGQKAIKAALRLLLVILALVFTLFGLVGMVTTSPVGGLLFVLGAVLMWPTIGDRISKLTGKIWLAPVVGLITAIVIGPVATVATAPSAEEAAVMAAQQEADKATKAEERAKADEERRRERALADDRKAEEKRRKDCSDTTMAYIMSRRFVERALVAPSTAKFPSFHADGVRAAQSGDCKFRVTAFVDAQNSFGAMIRTRYTIDMEYLPGDRTWRGTNLQM